MLLKDSFSHETQSLNFSNHLLPLLTDFVNTAPANSHWAQQSGQWHMLQPAPFLKTPCLCHPEGTNPSGLLAAQPPALAARHRTTDKICFMLLWEFSSPTRLWVLSACTVSTYKKWAFLSWKGHQIEERLEAHSCLRNMQGACRFHAFSFQLSRACKHTS